MKNLAVAARNAPPLLSPLCVAAPRRSTPAFFTSLPACLFVAFGSFRAFHYTHLFRRKSLFFVVWPELGPVDEIAED